MSDDETLGDEAGENLADLNVKDLFKKAVKDKRVSLESVLQSKKVTWNRHTLSFLYKMESDVDANNLNVIIGFHDSFSLKEDSTTEQNDKEWLDFFYKAPSLRNVIFIAPRAPDDKYPLWTKSPFLGKLLEKLLINLRSTGVVNAKSIHFIGGGMGAGGAAHWAGELVPSAASVSLLVPTAVNPIYNLHSIKTALYHDKTLSRISNFDGAKKYERTLDELKNKMPEGYKNAYHDRTPRPPHTIDDDDREDFNELDLMKYAMKKVLKLRRIIIRKRVVWNHVGAHMLTSYGILAITEKEKDRDFLLVLTHIEQNTFTITCNRGLKVFVRFTKGMFDPTRKVRIFVDGGLRVNQKVKVSSDFIIQTAAEQVDISQTYVGHLKVWIPHPLYQDVEFPE